MKFMEMLSKDLDYYGTLLKKLAPPLVTLLSAEPELQYVALRNINLIVQKRYKGHHTHVQYALLGMASQAKLTCNCAGNLINSLTQRFSARARLTPEDIWWCLGHVWLSQLGITNSI